MKKLKRVKKVLLYEGNLAYLSNAFKRIVVLSTEPQLSKQSIKTIAFIGLLGALTVNKLAKGLK
jgi:hypothetical protein